MSDRTDVAEANRLYWETETSVAEIASRLDLSRRALYDAVEPSAAGVACPECGDELHFENRSARRAGQATCASCGAVAAVEVTGDQDAPELSVVQGDAREDGRAFTGEPDIRHRAVLLGGAAIAGVALGTVAALIAMRRD
jgi:predicted RNA-binding Zn-ribbon protein involved in translation (DUF1610 family)